MTCLIRGGVQRAVDRLQINVRLHRADRGRTLGAQRFAGEAGALFEIQERIVAGIARALPDNLSLPSRPVRRRGATRSIAAYDEFLRGLERYGRRTPDDNAVVRRHLERAIALDPGFARAHAGLALAWSRLAIDGVFEPAEDASDVLDSVRFRPAAELTPEPAAIAEQMHVRMLRWFARSALIEADDIWEIRAPRSPPSPTADSHST